MRIALCISGQPRTWKKCYENWLSNILPDAHKDIFFHMWDYNSLPSRVNSLENPPVNENIKISEDEKNEIVTALNPINYKFDSREYPNRSDYPDFLTDYVSTPIGWWCRSQYYSLWYAARLKRQYEVENRFEYDIVFRLRTDLYFSELVNVPAVNTNCIYTNNNGWILEAKTFLVGDTFYFSDSFTYDQVSQFIHSLQFIDTYSVIDKDVTFRPPEIALYPFIRSLGIKNISTPQNFKILRTQEYLDITKELANYETL